MPKLTAKTIKASYQRRGGCVQFISSKKSSDDELSTTLQNDFFINLTGDDELCDTQEDQDFIEDLVDGDAAILNDLAT